MAFIDFSPRAQAPSRFGVINAIQALSHSLKGRPRQADRPNNGMAFIDFSPRAQAPSRFGAINAIQALPHSLKGRPRQADRQIIPNNVSLHVAS